MTEEQQRRFDLLEDAATRLTLTKYPSDWEVAKKIRELMKELEKEIS